MGIINNAENWIGNRLLAAKAYVGGGIRNMQERQAERNMSDWTNSMQRNYTFPDIEQVKNTMRNVQQNMVPIRNAKPIQQTAPVRLPKAQTNYDDLINKTFGDQAQIARAILMAESQGDFSRIGDKHLMFKDNGEDLGDSVGGFQIRTGGQDKNGNWNRARANGMSANDFRKKMLIPEENIKYAKSIYDRYGWNPWTTYTQETYKKYL